MKSRPYDETPDREVAYTIMRFWSEMLEALKGIRDWLVTYNNHAEASHMKPLYAAIAKAEGRS